MNKKWISPSLLFMVIIIFHMSFPSSIFMSLLPQHKILGVKASNTQLSKYINSLNPLQQSPTLTIVGTNKDPNPVVNVGNKTQLSAIDANGQVASDVTFSSDSLDVATIDAKTGLVTGVKEGFATITAQKGSINAKAFVVVAKVDSGKGKKTSGNVVVDSNGAIYLSNPLTHTILKRDKPNSNAITFAGQTGVQGRLDGQRQQSQFSGPTAVTVDNRPQGGVYIADSLNHSIRKVSFDDKVSTILGSGSVGINKDDATPFANASFNSPQGIVADMGGNLYIADTNNNAIYLADFKTKQVQLIAGEPGIAGKVDGTKRVARFNKPTAISLQRNSAQFFSDSILFVADTGNGVIRSVTRDGKVTTIGRINTTSAAIAPQQSSGNDFIFDNPRSVSTDSTGNIYVVDNSGVKVITQPAGQQRQLVSLAQPDSQSFSQAVSVVVRGNQALVLDNNANTEDEAVKSVTVGKPEITSMTETIVPIQPQAGLEGGTMLTLSGKNFAPESQVIIGDKVITGMTVDSARQIRAMLPPQKAPGKRTLSVQTRGGTSQMEINITSKPVSSLNNGEITTVAGGIPFSGDGGKAAQAVLNFTSNPSNLVFGGVTVDGDGNLLIADARNHRIRRIDTGTGFITSVAGNGIAGFAGENVPALTASLDTPSAIAVDTAGNIFIADTNNHRIRRVDTKGIITTIAGNGIAGFGGDDALAANSTLNTPTAIITDDLGNILFTDSVNHRVRLIDTKGTITTIAGNGVKGFRGDGGLATAASLANPKGLSLDPQGNLFISDTDNSRIRQVNAARMINTIAGNGGIGFSGDGAPALVANFNNPQAITADGLGSLLIVDSANHRVRRVDLKTGIITTIAGNGLAAFSGDNGIAISASLNFPSSVAIDGNGKIFITDSQNNKIRQVDTSSIITTIAGTSFPIGDGSQAVLAGLSSPAIMAVAPNGNIFIVDTGNNRIRRVDSSGNITTIAGNGVAGFSGDNGLAINASLNAPSGIAVDNSNNIFISDTGNNRVRVIDPSGNINTIAGNGTPNFNGDNILAVNASLNAPSALAVDALGNLYIADTLNNRVRVIATNTKMITTIAGNGVSAFSGDNGQANLAGVPAPTGITLDKSNQLFVIDSTSRVRQVNLLSKVITTIAGNGSKGFSGDGGLATNASLNDPRTVVMTQDGNILIADRGNNRIRIIDSKTKTIDTVAGSGSFDYSGDGNTATVAALANPLGVAVDSNNNLLVADTSNNSIRTVKGIRGANQPKVMISNAGYTKPNLTIDGSGFSSTGASVTINGANVSSFVITQSDSRILLKGKVKKLNLRTGSNQIVVTVNGISSNTFVLTL